MAIRLVTDCKGLVLWLLGNLVTVRGQYCGYNEGN